MIYIDLFCSAGMSTSLLAQKMQRAADEHGLPIEIQAYSSGKIEELVSSDHVPSCILLGPQVRFMYEDINERFGDEIPVSVIDSSDYGSLNGERVLKQAIVLIKQAKKN